MSTETPSVPTQVQHQTSEAIDADGDLTLVVGSDAITRFRVSKVAMRLASPVWKIMLTGRFAEASAKEVKLPADEPEIMRYLLLIAHLQLSKLPPSLSLDRLAKVAKLCDKYDRADMAIDRAQRWSLNHDSLTSKKGNEKPIQSTGDAVCWAWVGWVFGLEKFFRKAYSYLLDNVSPVEVASLDELPPGIKEYLLEGVESRFSVVLDKVYACLSAVQVPEDGGCKQTNPHAKSRCGILRQGWAMRLFCRLDLLIDCSLRPSALCSTMSIKTVHAITYEVVLGLKNDLTALQHGTTCATEFVELLTCVHTLLNGSPALRGTNIAAHFGH